MIDTPRPLYRSGGKESTGNEGGSSKIKQGLSEQMSRRKVNHGTLK